MKGIELKEKRKKLGYSQIKFAELLGVTRKTLGVYEKSETLSLSITNSINTVLEKLKEPLINTNGNKFIEKEDGSYNVTVRLVPFDAYASYVETLEDVSVVYEWEEVTFNVDQYGRGNYEAFRTKNDSMNGGSIDDTPSKSLVLGRELGKQHWLDGFQKSKYGWIVICKKSIMHKDITKLNKDDGTITCHSRNSSPEYSDFQLKLNDVYQIFKVIKRTF